MNFERLKRFIDTLPTEFALPGAEISVRVAHKELFHYTVGVSDLALGTPLSGGELYYFYSATKPITCAAVLQLFERGYIGLNDPIERYLPEFASPVVRLPDGMLEKSKRSISIAHLLTMTSGIDYNVKTSAIEEVRARTDGRCPTREIVRAIASRPLHFHPGERWLYGLSHDVLAALIEVVSGMRYSDYIAENIFRPLGMTNSYFHPNDEILSRMTTPYARRTAGGEPLPKVNFLALGDEYESGGASLISSVDDYALFADAMANGGVGKTGKSILLSNTIDLMRENHVGDRMRLDCDWPQLVGYGYGLGVRTLISRSAAGSLSSLGEFGWDGAKGVYLLIDPSRKLSVTYAEHRGEDKYLVQPRLRNLVYACLDAEE